MTGLPPATSHSNCDSCMPVAATAIVAGHPADVHDGAVELRPICGLAGAHMIGLFIESLVSLHKGFGFGAASDNFQHGILTTFNMFRVV